MAIFRFFLHSCWYSVNFHHYFYRMPKTISDGQIKSTTNGKKLVSPIFLYTISGLEINSIGLFDTFKIVYFFLPL